MKSKSNISVLALFLIAVVCLMSGYSTREAAAQGILGSGGPVPQVTNVTMTLSNISGSIVFRFAVDGTCRSGTDHINLSFSFGNSSTPLEPLVGWIGPMEMMVLGNGISLRGTGPEEDPWTTWSFRLGAYIPTDSNLTAMLALIKGLIGNLSEALSGLDIGSLVGADMDDLNETRIFLFARGFDSEGAFGEDYQDITDKVVPTLLDFAMSEGLLDDPDGEAGTEGNDDEGGVDRSLTFVIIIGSVVFEVLLMALIVYLLRKRRGQGAFRNRR